MIKQLQPLYQPQPGVLTLKYEPNEETKIIENPPRFTWLPADLEDRNYRLQIGTDFEFSKEDTETIEFLPYNFFTPNHIFQPGKYYWRYAALDHEGNQLTEWSKVRSFTIESTDLPETPLPMREERYGMSPSHPRLWINQQQIAVFRDEIKKDPTYCNWDVFYEKSVLPWIDHELINEPEPYPENKKVAVLWRKMYMDCQFTLNAIRHLSVAGVILEDEAIIQRAKEWLLHVLKWDTEGVTSRDYNDESAFRIAGALAWGYDWLFHYLNEEEKSTIRKVLFRRTEQVAHHVIERSKIHQVPYDSHAVRSLSSVLVPCCIALLDEEPKAREWLDYTLEYYSCIYTPWGGEDGGWAEGPHYWMTGMAYVIDAMNLVKNFTDIDFYKRPFFQKTGDFPLYVYSPDTLRATFGDQSNLGDKPGLKVGFNIRQFAGVTGNRLYQWYYERTKEWDIDADEKFYNSGWWDFRFDDMMYRYDYEEIQEEEPVNIEPVKHFKDVGWVAMHHKMEDPEEHIKFLTKGSSYGSISHSHGDQAAFLLHAFGEPLAIQSGYYVSYNSTMNHAWRRQTISKNSILINENGQYAGADKVLNKQSTGLVEEVKYDDTYRYARINATEAYKLNVPDLKEYKREFYFINSSYLVIVDHVELENPGTIDWLFHSLNKVNISKNTFRVEGEKANLDVRFVYSTTGDLTINQNNLFPGVLSEEVEGLKEQWHVNAKTGTGKVHQIATLLVPMKKNDPKYVSYFLDDQDHGLNVYCTDNGDTFRVVIPKIY